MRLPRFLQGFRLFDGSDLNDLADWFTSVQTGVTAYAGGGQTNATQLIAAQVVVATVATAADSVKLPASQVGAIVMIQNNGANSVQVFGRGTDTINGVAAATGVAQAAGKSALYFSPSLGKWYRILSA